MASPVSSTAASPFPGLGSTGQSSAQATGSPTSAKVASARDQSFLEAIPVRSPTVIPLEWSFPLTHRGKSEGTDSGSLKMDGNTSISSTAQPAGSMATLAQPLVSNIPSYLASETPASSLQVPSPATVAPDPAGQAGSHPQKPWRIQWASYRVRLEDASTERDSASSAVHGRGSKTSALSTPHGGLLQVPHGYADLPLKPISPVANLFDRNMGKTRPRASSDASKKSSASRQSSQKRKKRRVGGRHSSVESDSPESTLRTFYGDHNQSAYQAVLDALHNTDKATRLQLLLDGKRQFLTRASNFKADLALQDGKNPESLLCQGHLPERLAIIEFGNEAVRSEDGGAHVAEPRLYTFSLSSPDLDLSVYTGLEESSCYRNLDPEGSGTFTASDLFPSLYNDNGIYNPPTSLHAASVHPVPSAAALVTGQSSGYGKAPLFLSSLNISSSSNKEALAASDAFLKAVEEHVLQTIIQEHSRLETGVGIDESESSDIRRNSAYNTFEGIRCGHGVLLSHRDAQMDNKSVPQGYTAARVTPTESVFISCQAHFTAADVRVSARLDACCLTSSPVHSRTSNLPSSGLKTGSSSIINSNPVDRGRIVILCPMSLPASFLRWYGQQSPDTPRKQAELELENIATAKSELADLLQDSWGNDMSVAYENDWLLCALSDGTHAIWPARLAMLLPTSLGKEHIDQSVKRVKQQTRIKSSIAKASTRVSRRIFFRPQATKSSDLARSSLSSIEHQNKERAKERRDKAEKVVAQSEHRIMVATSKAEAAQLSYITGPKLDEAADACINAVDLHRGNLPSKNGGPLPLNDLGCPTFESITLALDALAGPDSISPPATTQQPGIVVLPPLPKGNAMLHDEHNKEEASRIYPTPQSLQNAANQPVGDLSTSTDGGDISQQPQSPVPPATRTIADIFQDFSWPSYSDTQPVQVRDIPSRPPSGGSGYASRGGVFDDPSTFGLFDSAGLTDDDFSFFDSPTTTANVLDNGSVGQDQFHTQRARFTHVPDLTPYDLASFVRSGPVDHFGHLMPGYTGATEPQTTSLHSHAHPPVDLYGLQLSASDPNEILSMTDSASTAPPLFYEEKAVQQQLQDASEGAGHRLEVTTRPRYHVSVNGHSKKEATGFGSPSARLPKTTSAWPSSFGPVTFQYPSPSPSSSADSTLKGPAGSHDDQGWLTRHRWTLAQRLKETVNKAKIPSSNLSQYNGRNWREAGHAVAWSSESTSASSSDEVSDEDAATLVDQENRHVPKVRTPLRSRDVVYAGLETTKFPMLPRPNLARAKEPAIRVTRGEKEAVATIFFQHLIENMDFRERQTLQRSVKCLASPLSTRISPLPAANASRKANDAETTDIGVYFEDAVTSFSVSSLCVWSKLGLRPFNGTKNIQAVVVAAAALIDNDVSRALEDWLNRSSGFGQHSFGSLEDCLFKLDCNTALISEAADLQSKLGSITAAIASKIAGDHGCVIYVLVDDADCQNITSNTMYLCLRLHLLRKGAIPHIVPLSSLTIGSQSIPRQEQGSLHRSALIRFAFNIYDRVPICVTRASKDKTGPNAVSVLLPEAVPSGGHLTRAFVAPAFHLVAHTPRQMALQLQWPPPSLDILETNRLFHIGYQLSDDRKWLYLAAVDDRAEYHCLRVRFVEGLEQKLVLKRVWNFLKEASECSSVQWRLCISRIGCLPATEVQAWCEIIQTSMHQLAHPAMITLCSISSASSVLSKWPQRPWSEAPPPHPSGLGLSATTNVYHAEGQASASISHSPYPSAIYGQQSETLTGVPSRPEKLYYSLASSSIYFKPLATCNKSMPPYTLQPLASYQINLLATATHPLSTYNRQLANHMVDLAQSYVDLYVLGRERWALTGDPSDSNSEQYLPWHLRAVSYMPGYDINALLPP